jgi:hypothetical protein
MQPPTTEMQQLVGLQEYRKYLRQMLNAFCVAFLIFRIRGCRYGSENRFFICSATMTHAVAGESSKL